MDTSLFLAKVFGIMYLASGVAILVRAKEFRKVMRDFMEHAYLTYFTGFMLTILGLLAVLSHNVWEGAGYVVVVTVISWAVLLKGPAYLVLPGKTMTSLTAWFDGKGWYMFAGIVSLVIGVYLASNGFGWM
ncbi:hypothetical protein BK004_02535 [bacterium CG10_46_32]|nr:MAG: hypothetical protein BK004_02535 [bacterium CG10_46_32]PIR56123.1 MAG: hypothetical protein COU73_02555 [Parcubacteria group bacterium CG10_big_fil_rev_8_21_14_0_10_46_32]